MKDNKDITDGRISLDSPPWEIYAIHAKGDPTAVWYVGQTNNLATRIQAHKNNSISQTHKPLYAHLNSHEWDCRTLEGVNTKDEARTAERRWIRHFIETGHELFNVQGRKVHSTRSKARDTKRKNARNAGVELIENSLVAIEGKFFTVYEWDEAQGDYVKTYLGTLD